MGDSGILGRRVRFDGVGFGGGCEMLWLWGEVRCYLGSGDFGEFSKVVEFLRVWMVGYATEFAAIIGSNLG